MSGNIHTAKFGGSRIWTLLLSIALSSSLVCAAASAETLQQVMKRRGLSQTDILAAAKTYTPTEGRDEFIA
ncbi:MAG: hypothetical protein JRJ58_21125, partial [Deltaproteobacteria bacterium]|nr:hypothetical protein [Deltaproteobacteria bacterium]